MYIFFSEFLGADLIKKHQLLIFTANFWCFEKTATLILEIFLKSAPFVLSFEEKTWISYNWPNVEKSTFEIYDF